MFELILLASIAGSSSPPVTSTPTPPPVYTPAVTGSGSAGSGSQPQRTSPLGPQQQQPTERWADKILKGIQERIRR